MKKVRQGLPEHSISVLFPVQLTVQVDTEIFVRLDNFIIMPFSSDRGDPILFPPEVYD